MRPLNLLVIPPLIHYSLIMLLEVKLINMYDRRVLFMKITVHVSLQKYTVTHKCLFLPTRNDWGIWVAVFNKWLVVRKKLKYLKIEFSLFEEDLSTEWATVLFDKLVFLRRSKCSWPLKNRNVHYHIYIIYSVHFDSIKLFIHDTFDILKSYIASICFGVIYAIHMELYTRI
jgi:hypothetical protein